jgi:hypothetical protein
MGNVLLKTQQHRIAACSTPSMLRTASCSVPHSIHALRYMCGAVLHTSGDSDSLSMTHSPTVTFVLLGTPAYCSTVYPLLLLAVTLPSQLWPALCLAGPMLRRAPDHEYGEFSAPGVWEGPMPYRSAKEFGKKRVVASLPAPRSTM